jgi:polar amino acid transport system substrate-binding protein
MKISMRLVYRTGYLLAAVGTMSLFGLSLLMPQMVWGRQLSVIQQRQVLSLCASPFLLPYASKRGERSGFQVEIAAAIAHELGVHLNVEWIKARRQARGVDCDILMDSIVDPTLDDEGLTLSKPYHVSGVGLVLPRTVTGVERFGDLVPGQRVGVISGSLVSALLGRRGITIIPYFFEGEMIAAVASGHVDAAAASPAFVGFYQLEHPDTNLQFVHAYQFEPRLRWQVAVGMRRADKALVEAVNVAIDHLLANGAITQIYAKYGIEHRPPK